jgi:ParB-like chromosome segregation protein Spo0J
MLSEPAKKAIDEIRNLPLPEKVAALNELRTALHEISPFADPVDLVLWVPANEVVANNYNPNRVASMEMKLLEHSIREDGYTQPIVSFHEPQQYTVVDGFHRNRVGKEAADITARLQGYLPVVTINKGPADLMASTIRHNRARGKHQVDLMGDLIRDLVQKGWNDEQIAKHLGMTEEELVRLKQLVGIAKIFATPEYSKSWGNPDEVGIR